MPLFAVGLLAAPAALSASSSRLIPEREWRLAAELHRSRVRRLLSPGFAPAPPPALTKRGEPSARMAGAADGFRKLDAAHPVFNFFEQYYGVTGGKGPRRLARWSPPLESPGGVLLEAATADDLGDGTLHLRGAQVLDGGGGVLYDPAACVPADASPFLWHRDVLAATEAAPPITSCYGLHEWAMLYHPEGAPEPPSARYQGSALQLRVDRETLNAAVEGGVSCTHVDALRFFAPAAARHNRHGGRLERIDQLRLEQPGCVHAHMDLLKAALRLSPWLPAELLADALEVAIAARSLDVAASPYDASAYGLPPIRVELPSGRDEYRAAQVELMHRAAPVRAALRAAFDAYLQAAFCPADVAAAEAAPGEDRFAVATPAGPPWRKALLQRPERTSLPKR